MTLFAEDALPDGVAFELLEVLAPFEISLPDGEKSEDAPTAEIESLVKRVVGRKCTAGGQKELTKNTVEELVARVDGSADPFTAVRALSHELQIAREFARLTKLAEGK